MADYRQPVAVYAAFITLAPFAALRASGGWPEKLLAFLGMASAQAAMLSVMLLSGIVGAKQIKLDLRTECKDYVSAGTWQKFVHDPALSSEGLCWAGGRSSVKSNEEKRALFRRSSELGLSLIKDDFRADELL